MGERSVKELPEDIRCKFRSEITIPSVLQCIEELVLNAIDSKATCIAVRVDLDIFRIQVVDNGVGISKSDMKLIGTRYATSKCHSLEDLQVNLSHYGFRGEALASIIQIAGIVELSSRCRNSSCSYSKLFAYGKEKLLVKCDENRPSFGTTVTIQDFMHNMPVRRKIIKESLELENIRMRLESIALIHPNISFSFRNDKSNCKLFQTYQTGNILQTFLQIFGQDHYSNMCDIFHRLYVFTVSGYISIQAHQSKSLQFIYVNKRLLSHTQLHTFLNYIMNRSSIIRNKAQLPSLPTSSGKISTSPPRGVPYYGIFILNIDCPFSEYDICLEPRKTLVEFKHWDRLLQCMEEMMIKFAEKEGITLSLDERYKRCGNDFHNSHVNESPLSLSSLAHLKMFCNPKEIRPIRDGPYLHNMRNISMADVNAVHGLPACRGKQHQVDLINNERDISKVNSVTTVEHNSLRVKPVFEKKSDAYGSDDAVKRQYPSHDAVIVKKVCPNNLRNDAEKVSSIQNLRNICHLTKSGTSLEKAGESNSSIQKLRNEVRSRTSTEKIHEGVSSIQNLRNLCSLSKLEACTEKTHGFVSSLLKSKPSIVKFPRGIGSIENLLKSETSTNPTVQCVSSIQNLRNVYKELQKNSFITPHQKTIPSVSAPKEIIVETGFTKPERPLGSTLSRRLKTREMKNRHMQSLTSFVYQKPQQKHKIVNVNYTAQKESFLEMNFASDLSNTDTFHLSPVNCRGKEIRNISKLDFDNLSLQTDPCVREKETLTATNIAFSNVNANISYEHTLLSNAHQMNSPGNDLITNVLANSADNHLTNPLFSEQNGNSIDYFSSQQTRHFPLKPERKCETFPHFSKHYEGILHNKDSCCNGNLASSRSLETNGEDNHSTNIPASLFNAGKPMGEVGAIESGNGNINALIASRTASDENDGLDCRMADFTEIIIAASHPRQEFDCGMIGSLPDDPLTDCNVFKNETIPAVEVQPNNKTVIDSELNGNKTEQQTIDGIGEDHNNSQKSPYGNERHSTEPICSEDSNNPSQNSNSWKAFTLENGRKIYINTRTGNTSFDPHIEDQTPQWTGSQPMGVPLEHFALSHGFSKFLPNKEKCSVNLNSKLGFHIPTELNKPINNGISEVIQDYQSPLVESNDVVCVSHPNLVHIDRTTLPESEMTLVERSNNTVYLAASENKQLVEQVIHDTYEESTIDQPLIEQENSGTIDVTLADTVHIGSLSQEPKMKKQPVEDAAMKTLSRESALNTLLNETFSHAELDAHFFQKSNRSIEGESSKLEKLCDELHIPNFAMDSTILATNVQEKGRTSIIKSYNIVHPYKLKKEMLLKCKVLGQVDCKFIALALTYCSSPNKSTLSLPYNLLLLVDQHAADERIQLEKTLRENFDGSQTRLKRYNLEAPFEIQFRPEEVRIMKSYSEAFLDMGLELTVINDGSVLFHTLPCCLIPQEPNERYTRRCKTATTIVEAMVKEMCDNIRVLGGPSPECPSHFKPLPKPLLYVMNNIACKNAVKFGETLSLEKCQNLMTALKECDLPFQCAHGRPSIIPIVDLNYLSAEPKRQKPNLSRLHQLRVP